MPALSSVVRAADSGVSERKESDRNEILVHVHVHTRKSNAAHSTCTLLYCSPWIIPAINNQRNIKINSRQDEFFQLLGANEVRVEIRRIDVRRYCVRLTTERSPNQLIPAGLNPRRVLSCED